jgi:Animal haem peroxidase
MCFFFILGRDQGAPTYLEMREKCGFNANFVNFDDLLEVFPQSYIDLLRNVYASTKDIDLLVGASLESFLVLDKDLLGQTFKCIFRDQFKRTAAGDTYFVTHSTGNPGKFTVKQLAAINEMTFSHLICLNTQLTSVPRTWYLEDSISNPKISCSNFNKMNLSPWFTK